MGFDRELSRSDMATMFEDHLVSAKAGDSFAKWRVGLMYYTGKGVLRDETEGVRWLEQAADAGVKWAQFAMGWICLRGKGGKKPDPARSLAYYRKAAATGDRYFAYALGEILYKGQGLPCDRVEGKRWLEKAAAGDRTFSELMAEVVATAR
jgi:TPR repeat protein